MDEYNINISFTENSSTNSTVKKSVWTHVAFRKTAVVVTAVLA